MTSKYTFILLTLLTSSCAFNSMFYKTEYAKNYTVEQSKIENVEECFLTNKDGIAIHSAFIKSKSKNIKGSIFMLHGNAGPLSTWLGMSTMYTSEGYNFYIMDYQGFGKSEGNPTHKNLLEDAQLAFNHFIKLNEVQNTLIIIHGISIGGHLSVKLAEQNQPSIKALVIDEAFSTHRKTARHNAPTLLRPLAYLMIGNTNSALKSIKNITIPTLILASNEDDTAPIKMSEQLFENCPAKQKELWNIGGEHMQGLHPNRKEYIRKLNEIIE